MDGFGPIQREANEPVFHEPWERRVFGMRLTRAGLPPAPLDAGRHRVERLEPVTYLSSSYYERWLAAMEYALVAAGTLALEEIEARIRQYAGDPDLPMPRREDPASAEHIAAVFRAGRPASRKIRQKPRFAVGEKIVTRNLNPHGHTRLPRYARGKRGVIIAHHGAHVFPDTNAHGLGENPQHLYTVRIAMRELWPRDAEPKESVLLDLWEGYLDKEKGMAGSLKQKRAATTKKMKTPPRKMPARGDSKRITARPPSIISRTSASSKLGNGAPKLAGAKGATRDSTRTRSARSKPVRRSR